VARKGAVAQPQIAKPAAAHEASHLLNEVAGVVAVLAAVFSVISFYSYEPGQVAANFGGPIGYGLAMVFVQTLGLAAYALPLVLGSMGIQLIRSGLSEISLARGGAVLTVVLTTSVLFGLVLSGRPVVDAGGWFGGFAARVLNDTSGTVGAYVIAAGLFFLALMFLTRSSLRSGGVRLATRVGEARQSWKERNVAHRDNVIVLKDVVNRKRDAAKELLPRTGPPVIVLSERAVVEPSKKRKRISTQEVMSFVSESGYQSPPLSLLDTPRQIGNPIDEDALRKSSEVLEAKLANFDIDGRVEKVLPGPVITTFEITPAPGVKVARITALQDDLALALRATSVRILAPIPGKPVVGIEVANAKREKVFLKEILETDLYANSESFLTLALGKDSSGAPAVADLARMPHLLLAGATGTGKSVSLNAMIMSILCKASPRDVRFVMIDLKMLELSMYENMPHLLVPVVTDPKKAVLVLKNLCELMDERYRILRDKGVRNIDSYNRTLAEEKESGGTVIELKEVVSEGEAVPLEQEFEHEHMPKIVVIIDELADLMITAGRHAEESITRLAQKARACGIHLILATQRPSVDVITGLIKANFPSRISFQVTSRVDSRTILDNIGAERLLGSGDMLYLPPGTARAQRLHGAYVSEAEIREVTNFIRGQGRPQYCMDLLEGGEDEESGGLPEDDFNDEMYDLAVKVVTETRQASISSVQRKLRIGYNRAARMIDRMEREGVVSASINGKPREVIARNIESDEE